MTEQFVAGLVGAPFGVNGFLKVQSLSGEQEHLIRLEEVLLRQHGTERRVPVTAVRSLGQGIVIQFAGITTPELARALTGAELIVDRKHAAPLKEGEYYVEDLRGVAVYGPDASEPAPLGVITGVVEGGGGWLVEVALPSGAVKLVPFRDEFFGTIDPEARRAVIHAPWILS